MTLSYVAAGLNAGVPAASFAKSNVNVSQSPDVVVVASVSTDTAGSSEFSIFSRTWTPAAAENTRTFICVFDASSGITSIDSFGPVDTTVPAKVSAAADRSTCTTMFVPPAGSLVTNELSAPPKPRSVYVTAGSSNVMGENGAGPGPPPPVPGTNMMSSK